MRPITFEWLESDNPEILRNHLLELGDQDREELLAQKNEAGQTVLHAAVQQENPALVEECLGWDLSPTAVDANGATAFDLAKAKWGESATRHHKGAIILALLKLAQEWQLLQGDFALHHVIRLLLPIPSKIASADGQSKILLIGRTGAGKSTWLNYSQDTRYELRIKPGIMKLYAERTGGNPELAKIGRTLVSETLYPQIFPSIRHDFVYCDLAGLEDTHGAAERICAASSLQLLSQLAGGIKALLVVLDLPSFFPRADAFRRTALALATMVQQNPSLMQSVAFVITHVRSEDFVILTVDGLLQMIAELLQTHYSAKAHTNSLSEEEKALYFMLQQMCMHPKHLFIANVADNGESAQDLEAFLLDFPVQESSQFDFLNHDASQRHFVQCVRTIIEKETETKNSLGEIQQALRDESLKKQQLLSDINQDLLDNRKQDDAILSLDEQINTVIQEISHTTQRLADFRQEIHRKERLMTNQLHDHSKRLKEIFARLEGMYRQQVIPTSYLPMLNSYKADQENYMRSVKIRDEYNSSQQPAIQAFLIEEVELQKKKLTLEKDKEHLQYKHAQLLEAIEAKKISEQRHLLQQARLFARADKIILLLRSNARLYKKIYETAKLLNISTLESGEDDECIVCFLKEFEFKYSDTISSMGSVPRITLNPIWNCFVTFSIYWEGQLPCRLFIAGTFNEWKFPDEQYMFALSPGNNTYFLNAVLRCQKHRFKYCYEEGPTTRWLPDGACGENEIDLSLSQEVDTQKSRAVIAFSSFLARNYSNGLEVIGYHHDSPQHGGKEDDASNKIWLIKQSNKRSAARTIYVDSIREANFKKFRFFKSPSPSEIESKRWYPKPEIQSPEEADLSLCGGLTFL